LQDFQETIKKPGKQVAHHPMSVPISARGGVNPTSGVVNPEEAMLDNSAYKDQKTKLQ
jgi:hypothetical protein